MERFNISLRKYLKEVGVTSQQAIEQVVRDEDLAGKGKLKVRIVLTGEGTDLSMSLKARLNCPTRSRTCRSYTSRRGDLRASNAQAPARPR